MLDARLPVPGAHLRAEVLARVQRARRARRGLHHRAGPRVRPDARRWPARSPGCGPRAATELGPPARPGRAARRGRRSRPTFAEVTAPAHAAVRDRHRGAAAGRGRPRPPRRCGKPSPTAGRDPAGARRRRRCTRTPRRIVALVAERRAARAGRRADRARPADVRRVRRRRQRRPRPLQGFARGQGVDRRRAARPWTSNGVEYVAVTKPDPGRGAAEVLSGAARRGRQPGCGRRRTCGGTTRSCRSPGRSAGCSRCWGDDVGPGRGVDAGRRPDDPGATATAADAGGRRSPPPRRLPGVPGRSRHRGRPGRPRATRSSTARAGAGRVGRRRVDVDGEAALIDQITNLVEAPTPLLGSFERALPGRCPREILTTVMRKHQRYLPVRDADGALLPHFVAVANGVGRRRRWSAAGNEAVLRARYEDAAFFWRADLRDAAGGHEGRAGQADLRRQARLDGRPGGPDRRARRRLAAVVERRRDDDPGAGRRAGQVRPRARRW